MKPFLTRVAATLIFLVLPFAGHAAGTDKAAAVPDGEVRARSAGAVIEGKPAPAAVLKTIDGETLDLGQLYGKRPVYLKFWATWCSPCREQMPGFEKIQQTHGKDLAVVAVNAGFSDSDAAVRAFRQQYGLHMPVVIDDGSLARSLNVRVTPTHVLIGRDGRVVHVGHLEDARFHEVLRRILQDKSPSGTTAAAAPATVSPTFGVGETLPRLAATTLKGGRIDLGGASAKPRAVVLFAPWCESYLADTRPAVSQACRRVRVDADKLVASLGNRVQWVGVASGLWASPSDMADYAKATRTALPLSLDQDGSVFAAFGVRQIPSVVLIDRAGRITRVLGPEDVGLAPAVQELAAAR
ncbi:MAG: TlpA disulfide reductase family protein [Rhizobacter sp.]